MFPRKEKGFMAFQRELPRNKAVEDRIESYEEFTGTFPSVKLRQQAYRCMTCGVPFCHSGCPLGNVIPDFNDCIKDDDWRKALEKLHATNNFPEFTGRVCPALCEAACVLGITESPVAIELLERAIADRGWEEGWITPKPPKQRTGKCVAVIGAGPAGLAAAQQLNYAGHYVTVFERSDEPGGLLTYGIPNFKLDKELVQRRVHQMEQEGIEFRRNTWVGKDVPATSLLDDYDAMLLTIGSTFPRDLDVPGRELDGIHFAMDFLRQQNRRAAKRPIEEKELLATDKNVVVIGGGDTGSDCIGTSIRQGAKHIYSLELLPKPPEGFNELTPWPSWPLILRTSSSHEEGGERDWSVLTKKFSGENGVVKKLHAVRLEWSEPDENGRRQMTEIPGSEFELDCDLVLLALGFVHPEHDIAEELNLERDQRGNINAVYGEYRTNHTKVYAAGDARRGQSLVVWAIHEGREAARCIDVALMGTSDLPSANSFGYDTIESKRT